MGLLIAALVWVGYFLTSGNWVVGLDAAATFLLYWSVVWAVIGTILMLGVTTLGGGVVGGNVGGVAGGLAGVVFGAGLGLLICVITFPLSIIGSWLMDTGLQGQTTWATVNHPYFIGGVVLYGIGFLLSLRRSGSTSSSKD